MFWARDRRVLGRDFVGDPHRLLTTVGPVGGVRGNVAGPQEVCGSQQMPVLDRGAILVEREPVVPADVLARQRLRIREREPEVRQMTTSQVGGVHDLEPVVRPSGVSVRKDQPHVRTAVEESGLQHGLHGVRHRRSHAGRDARGWHGARGIADAEVDAHRNTGIVDHVPELVVVRLGGYRPPAGPGVEDDPSQSRSFTQRTSSSWASSHVVAGILPSPTSRPGLCAENSEIQSL